MAKRYRVTLTQPERQELQQLISRGKADARKLAHARILLQADEAEAGPWRTDEQIASALNIATRTASSGCVSGSWSRAWRRRCCPGRASARLRPQARRPPGGEAGRARLLQSAGAGKRRWTLRLLADEMVELDVVDSLSHETVRQTLKKTS